MPVPKKVHLLILRFDDVDGVPNIRVVKNSFDVDPTISTDARTIYRHSVRGYTELHPSDIHTPFIHSDADYRIYFLNEREQDLRRTELLEYARRNIRRAQAHLQCQLDDIDAYKKHWEGHADVSP